MAAIVLPIAKPKPTGKPEVTEDGPDVPATRPPGLPDNDDDDEPEDGAVRLTVLYMVESWRNDYRTFLCNNSLPLGQQPPLR